VQARRARRRPRARALLLLRLGPYLPGPTQRGPVLQDRTPRRRSEWQTRPAYLAAACQAATQWATAPTLRSMQCCVDGRPTGTRGWGTLPAKPLIFDLCPGRNLEPRRLAIQPRWAMDRPRRCAIHSGSPEPKLTPFSGRIWSARRSSRRTGTAPLRTHRAAAVSDRPGGQN
jgi:hypothetical protein